MHASNVSVSSTSISSTSISSSFLKETFLPLLEEGNKLQHSSSNSSSPEISAQHGKLLEKINRIAHEKMDCLVKHLNDYEKISDEEIAFLKFVALNTMPERRKALFDQKIGSGQTILMKATEILGICNQSVAYLAYLKEIGGERDPLNDPNHMDKILHMLPDGMNNLQRLVEVCLAVPEIDINFRHEIRSENSLDTMTSISVLNIAICHDLEDIALKIIARKDIHVNPLDLPAPLEGVNFSPQLPLSIACQRKLTRVAKALIEKGANIYEVNSAYGEMTPLHFSCTTDRRYPLHPPSLELISHLYKAAKKDLLKRISLNVEKKIPPQIILLIADYKGMGDFLMDNEEHGTPLHCLIKDSVYKGKERITSAFVPSLNFILENGGIEQCNHYHIEYGGTRWTPLLKAAQHKTLRSPSHLLVRLMLEHGAPCSFSEADKKEFAKGIALIEEEKARLTAILLDK